MDAVLAPTMSLDAAAQASWDALIVGAGPAGAMAAHEMARRGASVLLVDQEEFPRRKACGGCVNLAGLHLLSSVGLGGLLGACGAQPLRQMRLMAHHRRATVMLPGGMAVSRERFDTALIGSALGRGAHFLPNTRAVLHYPRGDTRAVLLAQGQHHMTVGARVVLAADGLKGQVANREAGLKSRVAPHSRIGIGILMPRAPVWVRPGTIVMVCADSGYVGSVRLDAGQGGIAAAVDPQFVKAFGGPRLALNHLFEEAGLPPLDGAAMPCWQGTPLLTRQRPRVSAERLFVLGDAASYVEPFTGEGITWALASGMAVAPIAWDAARRWDPSMARHWDRLHRQLIHRRQRLCRLIASTLRHPRFTRFLVGLLGLVPHTADPVLRALNADLHVLDA